MTGAVAKRSYRRPTVTKRQCRHPRARASRKRKTFAGIGRLTSLTDPFGNVSHFIYDARCLFIEELDPTGNGILREYDAAGRGVQRGGAQTRHR